MSQQLHTGREEVRRLAWRNLATIVARSNTQALLPSPLAELLAKVTAA